MSQKQPHLKTKRLELEPMSDEEIELLIRQADTDEMQKAYGEMLDGCRKDPAHRIWYAPWKMSLRGNPAYIGDLCFKGPTQNGAVEIGYGIQPEYEGNGYMTEAVKAMLDWAFRQEGITFVEAETEPDNKASQRILEKCGFVPDGRGEEGPRFVVECPPQNYTTTYMCLGMSIGMAAGLLLYDQMLLGMAFGMSIGVGLGALLDQKEQKDREKLRTARKRAE